METLNVWEKYSSTVQNALESNEWRTICVLKTIEIEIQKDAEAKQFSLSAELVPPLTEIWSLLFNFLEISKAWERFCWFKQNLLRSIEWRRNYVLKAFKIEIQKRDQIIQTICRIRSTKKSGHPFLICENFRCVTAGLLNHTKRIEMYWMIKNLALSKFLNRDKAGGTK